MHDEAQIKDLLTEKSKPYDLKGYFAVFKEGDYVHVNVRVESDNKEHIDTFINETYQAITDGEVIFSRRHPKHEAYTDFLTNKVGYVGCYRFSVKTLKDGE
jgi:hypothetical protein